MKVLKLLTEIDIHRWKKAAVQGRRAIVKGLIALLWNSLVFPFVFEPCDFPELMRLLSMLRE